MVKNSDYFLKNGNYKLSRRRMFSCPKRLLHNHLTSLRIIGTVLNIILLPKLIFCFYWLMLSKQLKSKLPEIKL